MRFKALHHTYSININIFIKMGLCWPKEESEPRKEKNKNVQEVDIVKVKLKQARDKINNFVAAKNKDIDHIDAQLKEKIPKYQETGNKK